MDERASRHNAAMEPYSVLGVLPDATDEELARAYRELAKRHHPDHADAGEAAGAAAQMRQINAAYAALREHRRRTGPPQPRAPRRAPGWWLGDTLRERLGHELTVALDQRERVHAVAWAATGDSHELRLAVTERRLLWLRDDAIADRVRWLRLAEVESVEARIGRVRRLGELRVRARTRRRVLRFGEMDPDALRASAQALSDLLPAGAVRLPPLDTGGE